METPSDQHNLVPPPHRKKSDLEGLYHGMQFALTALLGLAVGYWLDRQRYLPTPLGTLGGLLAGSVAGMYVLAVSLNKK